MHQRSSKHFLWEAAQCHLDPRQPRCGANHWKICGCLTRTSTCRACKTIWTKSWRSCSNVTKSASLTFTVSSKLSANSLTSPMSTCAKSSSRMCGSERMLAVWQMRQMRRATRSEMASNRERETWTLRRKNVYSQNTNSH